ncbi:hypothetical protein PV703_15670 [Streptomyces sp. ME01-24h]|nr:hypothetical protein [Streptomyces sp. ME01-24h]
MSALILPAAGLLAGTVAYLLIRAAVHAARRIAASFTAARDTAAWARTTTATAEADDEEADAMDRYLDLADAVDAALPAQLVQQLQQLYTLEEETQ